MGQSKKVKVWLTVCMQCTSEEHAKEVEKELRAAYRRSQFLEVPPKDGWPLMDSGIEVVEE